MISSVKCVIFSSPVSVTRKLFSMPTAPIPGITYFGSSANTMFGSSMSFERGVSTGSSFIWMPMPCPTNLACCLVPHEVCAESLAFGDLGGYLVEFGTRCARPGDILDLAFDKEGCLMCPVSKLGQVADGEHTCHIRHISRIISCHVYHDGCPFFQRRSVCT